MNKQPTTKNAVPLNSLEDGETFFDAAKAHASMLMIQTKEMTLPSGFVLCTNEAGMLYVVRQDHIVVPAIAR